MTTVIRGYLLLSFIERFVWVKVIEVISTDPLQIKITLESEYLFIDDKDSKIFTSCQSALLSCNITQIKNLSN